MTPLDWTVVSLYLLGMIGMSLWLGSRHTGQTDYYLAGKKLGPWSIAGSMIATQCSAISLIGAPAFIAVKDNGGLKWLQYELAVPLAAIGILYLMSTYRKNGVVTIFAAVEERLGVPARKTLSLMFLCGRGLATGVALYAMSVVVSVCLDTSLFTSIVLVGGLSMIYTTIGGIEADIYSDILQLVILWISAFVCGVLLLTLIDDPWNQIQTFPNGRLTILQTDGNGITDGASYSLWPMLIGGFFLYLSYYGCDQSQAQRLLTAKDDKSASKAILLNGCLRLPLVLTYCGFGLFLGIFFQESSWLQEKMVGQNPDFIAPYFIIEYMPMGLRGLIVAGILAAAMSSLDSNINSMSAALENDFLHRRTFDFPGFRTELQRARSLTLLFGVVCCVLAMFFSGSQATVLELVNAVSSAFNGPILACFVLLLTKRKIQHTRYPVLALSGGVGTNLVLWLAVPTMSWLWWNVTGFLTTISVLFFFSLRSKTIETPRHAVRRRYLIALFSTAIGALLVFVLLQNLLTRPS